MQPIYIFWLQFKLRISSISLKAAQDFLATLEAYEDLIAARPEMKAVTYRAWFDATFFKSLVRSHVFSAQFEQVSELTDALIKGNLKEIAGKTKFVSV